MNFQGSPISWKVYRSSMMSALGSSMHSASSFRLGLFTCFLKVKKLAQSVSRTRRGPPFTSSRHCSSQCWALLQLVSALRRRNPTLHRYSGRAAVLCGLTAAISGALVPFALIPPRPFVERLYIVLFFTGVALFLLLGFRAARRHDYASHRAWMIRAVASAGGVVTQRIVFPILIITFGFRSASAFWMEFVAAFALGWGINLALAEVWLRWKPSGQVQATEAVLRPVPNLRLRH